MSPLEQYRAQQQDIIERRRELVAGMRLRGFTVREIVAGLAEMRVINPETNAPFAVATIHSDIEALSEQWKADAAKHTNELKSRINAEIEAVKREGWKNTDLQNILKAIEQQRKLFGLDAPTQSQIGGIPGGEAIQVTGGSLLEGIELGKLSKEELDSLEAAVTTLERLRANQGAAGGAES